MRTVALAFAVLLAGPALAQTTTDPNMSTDQTMATTAMTPTPAVVQPDNSAPRHDARGIAVISDPAVVPAGWNGTVGTDTGMGGPLLDPNTGQPISDTANYPPCSRTVTDKCVQTYERHRAR